MSVTVTHVRALRGIVDRAAPRVGHGRGARRRAPRIEGHHHLVRHPRIVAAAFVGGRDQALARKLREDRPRAPVPCLHAHQLMAHLLDVERVRCRSLLRVDRPALAAHHRAGEEPLRRRVIGGGVQTGQVNMRGQLQGSDGSPVYGSNGR